MRRFVMLGEFVFAALACAGTASAANLVMNPGFETLEAYIGPWPTTAGVWKGDISQGVGAENGVTPIGSGMLKFVETRWVDELPSGVSGDLLQLVDLAPFASHIAGGQAKVRYAAQRPSTRCSRCGCSRRTALFRHLRITWALRSPSTKQRC
jgi:hypothetical protein